MKLNLRIKTLLSIISIWFISGVNLFASDILINTKPNPVHSGNRMRISLAAELPIKKVTAVLSTTSKFSLSSINDSLFVGNYI